MKKILCTLAVVVLACVLASCNLQIGTSNQPAVPSIAISEDGYWIINGEKTNVKAQGEKGEQGEVGRGILKVEIIDGDMWITYTDAPDAPVNLGCVTLQETTLEESIPEQISPEETIPDNNTDLNVPAKPPVGTKVGNTCPTISLDIVGSDEKFDVQKENAEGRVVVLNFWYTTCGPCLEELPYFYEVAVDYSDRVSVAAIHIEQPGIDVTGFIANSSGHPEWNDGKMTIGWDTGMKLIDLFNISACPVTVVINTDGVITDYFVGGLHKDELVSAVQKALGE